MGSGGPVVKICVFGLWHLGTVTAACLGSSGHQVVGLDCDATVIENLKQGKPPVFEPGLSELISSTSLEFTSDKQAARNAEIVWVAFDTPVDQEDNADVDFVIRQVQELYPYLNAGTLVLVSSQLPVGSVRRLENSCPDKSISFAYSPENLRLGKAIEVFTKPDRVIAGIRNERDKSRIEEIFRPWKPRIEWMSVESAEMTKHAINAFLATSVTFINELSAICEQVGADAKEVERGLKTESRIGPKAYLSPGAAFAGGTLARDVRFLTQIGAAHGLPMRLMSGVHAANNAHRNWARRRLSELLGDLRGRRIAVWGLTYKPGTDTLRRSSSVELCLWLEQQGAQVFAHDPAIRSLPRELRKVHLCASAKEALSDADTLVVATEWNDYKSVDGSTVIASMKNPTVLDASRFLVSTLGADPNIRYVTVGKPVA
jgi:UDPglucose 6-dehydrogenase